MILDIVMGIFGIYLIIISLITFANGTKNKILLKVIPFFAGLYALVYSVLNMGIISFNI